VIAEIIGAVASNSLFLIGDAAAMSVDVVSYACSTWGERIKDRTGTVDASTRMWINIYVPLASVAALLAVRIITAQPYMLYCPHCFSAAVLTPNLSPMPMSTPNLCVGECVDHCRGCGAGSGREQRRRRRR